MYAADGISLFQNSKGDSPILACLNLCSVPFFNFDTSNNLGSAESNGPNGKTTCITAISYTGPQSKLAPFMPPGLWVRGVFRYQQSPKIRHELGWGGSTELRAISGKIDSHGLSAGSTLSIWEYNSFHPKGILTAQNRVLSGSKQWGWQLTYQQPQWKSETVGNTRNVRRK